MDKLNIKEDLNGLPVSQEAIRREVEKSGNSSIYSWMKDCVKYTISNWRYALSIVGLIAYFLISSYMLLRISQVFLLPQHFVHRTHERALLFLGFNIFCFLPFLALRARWSILKANLLAAIFAYAFFLLIGTTDMVMLVARPLLISDELSDADAVVVLDSGYADLKFAYGAQLYKLGYADTIMVFLPKQHAAYLARKEDIPPEAVFCAPIGANTHEHAVLAGRIFKEKGWHKGILVTLSPHMLRASKAFAKQGLSMIRASIPDSLWYGRPGRFIDDWKSPRKVLDDYGFWDRCKIRHIWLMQVLHEYIGILKYYYKSYI